MRRVMLLLTAALVLVLSTAILVRAAQPASAIRTYQNASHETQYVIPPRGTPYCFNAESDLPRDLPACPNVDWNGAATPNPDIGPTVACPSGEIEITVAPWCAKPAHP